LDLPTPPIKPPPFDIFFITRLKIKYINTKGITHPSIISIIIELVSLGCFLNSTPAFSSASCNLSKLIAEVQYVNFSPVTVSSASFGVITTVPSFFTSTVSTFLSSRSSKNLSYVISSVPVPDINSDIVVISKSVTTAAITISIIFWFFFLSLLFLSELSPFFIGSLSFKSLKSLSIYTKPFCFIPF